MIQISSITLLYEQTGTRCPISGHTHAEPETEHSIDKVTVDTQLY